MQQIVVAANVEANQPWVADAAADLARQTGAQVAVVSVDEVETQMLATLPRSEYVERAEKAADAMLERLRQAGVEADREVRSGAALEQIMAFADERDADLIVVGSSTRGRLATRLLGSVPIALIQRAGRPVLVVTGPGQGTGTGLEAAGA